MIYCGRWPRHPQFEMCPVAAECCVYEIELRPPE